MCIIVECVCVWILLVPFLFIYFICIVRLNLATARTSISMRCNWNWLFDITDLHTRTHSHPLYTYAPRKHMHAGKASERMNEAWAQKARCWLAFVVNPEQSEGINFVNIPIFRHTQSHCVPVIKIDFILSNSHSHIPKQIHCILWSTHWLLLHPFVSLLFLCFLLSLSLCVGFVFK